MGVITIKAVIMAGGEGTRLRPLTCALPKPMVPILNKPIMEYIIRLLKKNNIEEIGITLAYLPDTIMDHFDNGEELGVKLHYYVEETPLGTGGSVKNAQEFLDDTFIVISGDALTDIHLQDALDFHRRRGSKATLVLKKEAYPLEYGVIVTNHDGRIIRFLEKPSWGEVFSDTINTGIYILEPEVMDYYKRGERFDFSKDLFPKLLRDKIPMYGYVSNDYWCDIGDVATYTRSQFDILKGQFEIGDMLQDYTEIQKNVWVGKHVLIHDSASIQAPVLIGDQTTIGEGALIGPGAIIGKNCKVGEGSSIKHSILWDNNNLARWVQVRGSTICSHTVMDDRVNLFHGSVIGNNVRIKQGSTIHPDVKIWPYKEVEENTHIHQHLIWGERVKKSIFGHRDISGRLNIDIYPEFASQLGSVMASSLEGEGGFVVACDLGRGSQLIKQSLANGILATGQGVIDIGTGPLPLHRYAINYFEAQGGAYISSNPLDGDEIHIEIMNQSGANIPSSMERKIENLFNRGDFQRSNSQQISSILQQDFSTTYIAKGLSLVEDLERLKMKERRVILASPSDSVLFLASSLLEMAGCKVRRIRTTRKPSEYFQYIRDQIIQGEVDLGFFLHRNGDQISLLDEEGTLIQQEDYELLAYLILLKKGSTKKLVAPHTFPEALEWIAQKYDGEVVRTKSAPSQVMNELLGSGGKEPKDLLPYILHFDGIWSTLLILDYLDKENTRLSNLRREIPNYHYRKASIPCTWQDKGRVIKEIISQKKREDMELFEGVKIKDRKGWAIIIPDSEKPLFNLYVQGANEEYAQELSTQFKKELKDLIGKDNNQYH